MSTDQRTGGADINGSPTTDSTDLENTPDSNADDEHDPYAEHADAHGMIRDDGSPLVEGQLYPSTVDEHMRLIKERAAGDDDLNA